MNDNFKTILEQELGIRTFEYPEDEGHALNVTDRILHFGTAQHPTSGNRLVYGLDLNALTADDLAILMKPEYLKYAWEAKGNPRRMRDRLIRIINQKEGPLPPKGGAEEPSGGPGYRLVYGRGPAEYHAEKKTDFGYIEAPHFSRTSAWKTYYPGQIDSKEIMVLDLDDFRNVLHGLHEAGDEYTIANLSDDYLRTVSETGESQPIKPEDIVYDEPEDHIDPDFVDEKPIEPDEIDKAKAKEVEEPEVDVEFEPEPEDRIEKGQIETEFEPEVEVDVKEKPDIDVDVDEEPDIEVEAEFEPEEPKTDLEPDISKAIDKRIRAEREKEMEREVEREKEIEDEAEVELEDEVGEAEEEPEETTDMEDEIESVMNRVGLSSD